MLTPEPARSLMLRASPRTGELVELRLLTAAEIAAGTRGDAASSAAFSPVGGFLLLASMLKRLQALPVGSYVVRHRADDSTVTILQEASAHDGKRKRAALDLSAVYADAEPIDDKLVAYAPLQWDEGVQHVGPKPFHAVPATPLDPPACARVRFVVVRISM